MNGGVYCGRASGQRADETDRQNDRDDCACQVFASEMAGRYTGNQGAMATHPRPRQIIQNSATWCPRGGENTRQKRNAEAQQEIQQLPLVRMCHAERNLSRMRQPSSGKASAEHSDEVFYSLVARVNDKVHVFFKHLA